MSFKLKATGFGELAKNLRAVGIKISPQKGIADSLMDGAWVIALQARDNAVAQGLIKSGALIDSIVPVVINQFRVDIKVGVVYGAAHEFGVTVRITEKQRRFFWAMWRETGDMMWKALALSDTYTIPAKPYVRPAIDERKDVAYIVVGRSIKDKLLEVLK